MLLGTQPCPGRPPTLLCSLPRAGWVGLSDRSPTSLRLPLGWQESTVWWVARPLTCSLFGCSNDSPFALQAEGGPGPSSSIHPSARIQAGAPYADSYRPLAEP